MKPLLLALTVALVALSAPASARSQLEAGVERELRRQGFRDVDVSQLTIAQLAAIHSIATRAGREGQRRGQIRSVLGGSYSLRGTFRR